MLLKIKISVLEGSFCKRGSLNQNKSLHKADNQYTSLGDVKIENKCTKTKSSMQTTKFLTTAKMLIGLLQQKNA